MADVTENDYVLDNSLNIAIIGLAGTFPGAANIEQYWENLMNGKESVRFFTDDELKEAGVTQEELEDKNYVKAAPVLDNIEYFDASFFEYTPIEASLIDPQQRLLLECAWKALEHAGYAPGEKGADSVGVFAGVKVNTYANNIVADQNFMSLPQSKMQVLLGNGDFALATRISYKLNLKGPSYMLQTACSTSLAAIHLACQSLLMDECRMALAGGAAVEVPQKVGYQYQYGSIVSPDGHCRPFDSKAVGTVFGNGVGMVVLKRLDDAISDGDHIYAVIKGTATNNDGSQKASFTAPSVEGQTRVILEALACSGVDADTISYIEAHGSGTSLGDSIELMALTNAFRSCTKKTGFCKIGSVKGNIGHLDAAAGIAGIIKTTLAIENKMIPPSINYEGPNPEIDFAMTPFTVSTEACNWKTDNFPRRAGVSSFGFGGTNTHIIMEEAPMSLASSSSRPWQILQISAKTASALESATENLGNFLSKHTGINLADVAYTLQTGRCDFNHRRVFIARDAEEACSMITNPLNQGVITSEVTADIPSVVFMFPGQGSQYINMGRGLYDSEPVFRQNVDLCAAFLKNKFNIDILSLIYSDQPDKESVAQELEQTSVTQPALFVIEYSLAKLLISWGITPTAMIGHSIGEYVAACLSGVFELEDALSLVVARGSLMQSQPRGAMLSIPLPAEKVKEYLNEEVSIAASNGPSLCVLSGTFEAIDRLEKRLEQQNVSCRRLHTSHAFHSGMMDGILMPFIEEIKKYKLKEPAIQFISNVTGTWIKGDDAISPEYWARHLRGTVHFSEGINKLIEDTSIVLLEVGPGRALSSMVRQQIQKNRRVVSIPTMRHPEQDKADQAFILNTLGQLWSLGINIDWKGFYKLEKRKRVALPTYPFERQRYWIDPPKRDSRFNANQGIKRKETDITEWFYIPAWRQSMLPFSNALKQLEGATMRWLIFIDEYGVGSELIGILKDCNQEVIVVQSGSEYCKSSDNVYCVNPENSYDYENLAADLCENGIVPDKILHLWLITSPESVCDRVKLAEEYLKLGFNSLMFLVQAMASQNINTKIQMSIISNNMHQVSDDEITYPEKATILGTCKVIPKEYTNISCRSIDIRLPDDDTYDVIQQVLAEIMTESPDTVTAYRGKHRWAQALEKVQLKEAPDRIFKIREEGTYLIAGGLGGIGLVIAENLARKARAKLIFTNRSSFPARNEWVRWIETHEEDDGVSKKIKKLMALEEMGSEILVVQADVSSREEMRKAVNDARSHFGAIHGVIHSAGVAGGGIIQLKTPEATNAVMAAKVKGTLIINELFENEHLDFMVLFSSINAFLGEFSQVDYCAANSFLDAFAWHNTFSNRKFTISVNWDVWKEIGMAVNTELPEALKKHRNEQMKLAIIPSEGAEAFNRILNYSQFPQIIVCTSDLHMMIKEMSDLTKSNIFDKMGKPSLTNQVQSRPNLHAEYIEPGNETEKMLAELWQQVLGVEPIGIRDDFFELGGHSILAIQIVAGVRENFQVELSLKDMFKLSTVEAMAKAVAELMGETSGQKSTPSITGLVTSSPEERYDPFPLTDVQQAYWIGRSGELELGNVSTHSFMEYDIAGLDIERFENALQQLIERHDMLRAIVLSDGRQKVLEKVEPYKIEVLDLRGFKKEEASEKLKAIRDRMSHQVLPTDKWPLFEIRATMLDDVLTRIHVSMDLLIGDAWSTYIFLRELNKLYQDPDTSLPNLEFTFRDYVLTELSQKNTEVYQRSLEYWRNRIKRFPASPELPLAVNPGSLKQPYFTRRRELLDPACWESIKSRASREGLTTSIVLATVFSDVLKLWCKNSSFVLNLTLFNRQDFHPQVNDLVGDFTSLTLLEIGSFLQDGFIQRAQRIQEQLWSDLDYRYVSGVQVLREMAWMQDGKQGLGMPVVFTSTLTHSSEQADMYEQSKGETSLFSLGNEVYSISQTPQVWLDHQVLEQDGLLVLNWDAVEELFPDGMLDEMFETYIEAIKCLGSNEEAWTYTTRELVRLSERRLELQLSANSTYGPIYGELLHTLFNAQAGCRKDQVAITAPGKILTYEDLFCYSNKIGRWLRNKGVDRNKLVAVVMNKGWEQIAAVLGILQSGAAYLPISAELPWERILYLLENGETDLVLTQSWIDKGIEWPQNVSRLCVDNTAALEEFSPDPLSIIQEPDDLAYVIYTSGSTGQPKGVMIDHKGAVNTILDINDRFEIGAEDKVLSLSALNFDLSVYDIFGTLAAGGTIVLPGTDYLRDPGHWAKLISEEQITVWNSVPALMNMLVEFLNGQGQYLSDSLRLVMMSGDWIPVGLPGQIRKLGGDISVVSLGGATEASIWSIIYPIEGVEPEWKSIPYGKALTNQRFYVLDESLETRPVWTTGQLYIGGVGLAKGYWNDMDKTDASFIVHPRTGERLYRTGDLGRYLPDGNIEFLGREDTQVKIQGYRIELGEIEAALNQHESVQNSVVNAIDDGRGNKYLAAYVVPEQGSDLDPKRLKQFLQEKLPQYMVPVSYTGLTELPLGSNGKVNRRALPKPEQVQPAADKMHDQPGNPVEEKLISIWQSVLGAKKIGIYDNFFEVGGNSILAIQVLSQLRQEFQVEIPLRKLFETPTIAVLADEVNERKREKREKELEELPAIVPDMESRYEPFPLTDVQQAYWVGRSKDLELGNISTHTYMEFQMDGLDIKRFESAMNKLIKRHEMLRAVFLPDGQQRILETVPNYAIEVLDLSETQSGKADTELQKLRDRMSHQILELDKWPLFEINASVLPGNIVRLHISIDLLIGDAWSLQILRKELSEFYDDPELELQPIEASFRDYVLLEEKLKETELYKRSLHYWRERMPGLPPAPELPLAVNPGTLDKPCFVRRKGRLEKERWERLKSKATQAGLTQSGVLAAAYAEVLAVWSKRPDFTLNLTLFNRLPIHQQVNMVVGDFTSVTLLAVDNSGRESFETHARKIQQQLWNDLDNRYIGGVTVIRELARSQGGGIRAAMPVVFTSTLNIGSAESSAGSMEAGEDVYSISQTPQVWLDHVAGEQKGDLVFNWDAVEEIFPEGLLDDMFEAYCNLLKNLADDNEVWNKPVYELILLPLKQDEQRKAVNASEDEISCELLHTLFLKNIDRLSDKVAIVSPTESLTYKDLYRRSNRIGRWLRDHGAVPDTLVAVLMEKGWEQVVAVLGILNSGAAYLPISADLPEERIKFILQHGEVTMVITQSQMEGKIQWPDGISKLCIDTDNCLNEIPDGPLDIVQSPDDLAYVIYTSGSTGLPKGVMINHRGAVNTILDINRRFDVSSEDRILALSSLSFDLSVYDIFGALAAGGTIVIPDVSAKRDPLQWAELIRQEGVTIWNSVPALMQMLADYMSAQPEQVLDSVRLVLMSGDWIPVGLPDQIRKICGDVDIISLGGATEASIWSILYPVEEVNPDWNSIPYGKPMANQKFFVLDDSLENRPDWVPGQLYIGGTGLAKGYWRDEERTKASFIENPHTGERMYKTGDLGRYLPDGNIEFLGREDFQVKIQGYRIELGEIESALNQHELVQNSVVTVFGQEHENKSLVAYFVPRQEAAGGYPVLESVRQGEVWEVIEDPIARLKFKMKHLGIRNDKTYMETILDDSVSDDIERACMARRSYRKFNSERINQKQLLNSLSCLKQLKIDGVPLAKYQYGSAGSLYPVQVYIYIKENMVDGVRRGVYYYHPGEHCLVLINENAAIQSENYSQGNREIFEKSAFAVFLIAKLGAIEPLYGEWSHDFCMLEAGLMTQLMEISFPEHLIGLCQTGGFEFEPIRKWFGLDDDHMFLHSLLGGGIDSKQTGISGVREEMDNLSSLMAFLENSQADTNPDEFAAVAREAVYTSNKVYRKYRNNVINDQAERLKFKMAHYGLRKIDGECIRVRPDCDGEADNLHIYRRSHRKFNTALIEKDELSSFLKCLKGFRFEGVPMQKYTYASAGSLYPVQTYLYIKPERVKDLEGGIYYYHPEKHSLVLLSPLSSIEPDLYPQGNREIFENAAFAIFLISQMNAITPMYANWSRDFSLIEAGLMSQMMEMHAAKNNIGLCQIGSFNFEPIRDLFRLDEGHVYMHSLLGGKINKDMFGIEALRKDSEPMNLLLSLAGNEDIGTQGSGSITAFDYTDVRDQSTCENMIEELREHLRSKLPEYMVPSVFIPMEALPLSANGKIDRKSLPSPNIENRQKEVKAFQGPQTELESRIASVWQEVLKVDKVSIHDSFFDLGGNSVHLIRAYNKIVEIVGKEVPIITLFENPTIYSLCQYLSQEESRETLLEQSDERADARKASRARRRQDRQ